MFAPRLINMLQTFSPDETKNFEKFLLSPFFNTSKTCVNFYKELIRFYPDFRDVKLSAEYIFGKMFSGKQFHKQTMWNLSSGLEKLMEEFLIHSALMKQPQQKFNLVIDELGLRILGKHYAKKLIEREKILKDLKIDAEQLQYFAHLEENKVSYWQQIRGIRSKQPESYFKMVQIYTLDYLMIISRIINSLNAGKAFGGYDRHNSMVEEFVRNIDFGRIIGISKKNRYKYASLIEFYYNIIYCNLDRENGKYFFKVKEYLFKNHELFSDKEKKDITSTLANYCVEKNLVEGLDFSNELFEINKFRLKHGLAAYLNGKIGKSLYKQIFFNAIYLKKINWAEKFINDYTPLLHESHQSSMMNLTKAYIFFHTKKYNEVLNSLNKFNSSDVVDKMNVKNLIARTYYEMGESEILLYHIDSTNHFLRKNRNVSKYLKEVNSKFYKYLHLLVIAVDANDRKKLIKLQEEIKNENTLKNKVWLIEKISEAVQKA